MPTEMSDEIPAARNAAELSQLAAYANRKHHAAQEHAKQTLLCARAGGEALNEAKARVDHGGWGDWLAENFEATPQTARNYMRIARRWPDLEEAMAESENAFSIRRAIGFLAGSSDDDGGDERDPAAQGRLVEVEGRTASELVEDAIDRVPRKERARARRILRRFNAEETVRARVVRGLAEMTPEELRLLYDACLKRGDADDVAEMAHRERTRLLLSGRRPIRDQADTVEEARPVLSLQALLRWAITYRDQTERAAILDGLRVARNVDKMAADLLGVAGWMIELASSLRFRRPAALPNPADVVVVGDSHQTLRADWTRRA